MVGVTTIHAPATNSRDTSYRIGVNHLRTYTAAQGHANVPYRFVTDDGFKLGIWVRNRRQDHKSGRLSGARNTELNVLGMVWGSSPDSGYRSGVDHLRAYATAQGNANVPQGFVTDDGFHLGVWVTSRRQDRKVGRLSTAKVTELSALGMVWDPRGAGYRIGVDHFRSYAGVFGHANTPRGFVTDDGFKLGEWVSNRRSDRRTGQLSTAKVTELNTLGMVWDLRDANYRIGVNHFRTYTAREGHAKVPQGFVTDDGYPLGRWVNSRRQERKAGQLTTAKVTELDALGMAWSGR